MGKVIKLVFVTAILTLAVSFAGVAYALTFSSAQIGNSQNNTLNGNSSDNYQAGLLGDDTLNGRGGEDSQEGGPGRDDISGNGGDDVITPGDGRDVVDGDRGDDTIQARDFQRDFIDCGPGEDFLFADNNDNASQNCESVDPEEVNPLRNQNN